MEILNIFSVIGAFFLPLVFNFGTLFQLTDYFANRLSDLVFLLVFVVITLIAYIGSAVQGLRSIFNGRTKTIVSASVYQLILFRSEVRYSI